MQGVEVQRLNGDTEVCGGQDGTKRKFAAGSYVVRMDQPYSRMADMLLDTQYLQCQRIRRRTTHGMDRGPAAQHHHGARRPSPTFSKRP